MEIVQGPVPAWRQIYDYLAAQIDSGELAPGDRIPSIRDLAQTWGVALTTAQKTMNALRQEGKIVTSPMGAFVANG
jgi:DNA-binding transcriptional regulator YhcF (GntR family)